MGVTFWGTAVGLLASRLLHAPYSATALLWFETKDRAAGSRDPRASEGDELLNPSGWIDLVESNAVLEEVVRQRRLYFRPPEPADSSPLPTPPPDRAPLPPAHPPPPPPGGRTLSPPNNRPPGPTRPPGRPA